MPPRDPTNVVVRGAGLGTILLVSLLTSTVVSIAVVFVAARWGLVGLVTDEQAQAPPSVEVPNLVTMSADAAKEVLRTRDLRMVVRERRSGTEAPADTIIEQMPLPESTIPVGEEVAVVVSSGPRMLEVPDVIGKTRGEAKKLVEAAGLRVGVVEETDKGEPGKVTATDPEPGTEARPGAAIMLTVARSEGEVPDVVGKRRNRAEKILERAGFEVGRVRQRYDERYAGYIILSQDPEAGSSAAPGSSVDLVMNEGD